MSQSTVVSYPQVTPESRDKVHVSQVTPTSPFGRQECGPLFVCKSWLMKEENNEDAFYTAWEDFRKRVSIHKESLNCRSTVALDEDIVGQFFDVPAPALE
jgi:hypothetical protein